MLQNAVNSSILGHACSRISSLGAHGAPWGPLGPIGPIWAHMMMMIIMMIMMIMMVIMVMIDHDDPWMIQMDRPWSEWVRMGRIGIAMARTGRYSSSNILRVMKFM